MPFLLLILTPKTHLFYRHFSIMNVSLSHIIFNSIQTRFVSPTKICVCLGSRLHYYSQVITSSLEDKYTYLPITMRSAASSVERRYTLHQ